jgi:cobalt-zinc-cadmium efflux system outer membrane protein
MWDVKKLVWVVLLVMGSANLYGAQSDGNLTLREALALTVLHHPELAVFSLEIRAAESRQLQASLRPNPVLKMQVEEVGGGGERSGFDAAETTIFLSQLIEIGGKAKKREKVASFEKELAGIDYEQKKLDIFSQAAKAFIAVLQSQEKRRLSKEILALSEESFAAVGQRVDAGKDSPVEKTRASVSLSKIKISHRKSERNLEFSRKKLASFWAEETLLFDRVVGDLDRIEDLPLLEDMRLHLKRNPGYVRWGTEISRSQALLDLEKSKAFGNILIGAGVQRFNETDDNTVKFTLSIPLPLSDRNQGAKQAAVYKLAQSHERQKSAWLKLKNDFNQTYQNYADAYSQAISLKNEVLPAATQMFDAATRAYEEGKMDYLNVLDAQRTLFEIKDEYLESLAGYHVGKIDIERLIGAKIETLDVSESEK